MRSTQNDGLALVQENPGGEISCTTLQGDVDALIQSLQARANKLNKKRRTRDDRTHWIVRGRQQALRHVSARLFAIGVAYVASYTLYLALQEYLACLDKYGIDVEEERHAAEPRNGLPIEQWKAEGEAQELPRIARVLSRMVQAHAPDSVRHTLSLDGKNLVSLGRGSDEPSLKCEVREPAQPRQVFEWSRLPADSHTAGELVLAASESRRESAPSPVRCSHSWTLSHLA